MSRIIENTPWNSNKNIGQAYNSFMNRLYPNEYAFFRDRDTYITDKFYGKHIEDIISLYPDVAVFSVCTNRVMCKWQIAQGVDRHSNDLNYHEEFGKNLLSGNYLSVKDVTNEKPFMSGVGFVVAKWFWTRIGGVSEKGMAGIDNAIHKAVIESNSKLFLMEGVYLYHWYRNNNIKDNKHLFND